MKALAALMSVTPASLIPGTSPGSSPGTVLQRPERPFRSASGLRRIGPDGLDPERLKGPADLGRTAAVDLAGLGAEIVRAAVGVEAHRQAVLGEHLPERPEGRGRAFLFDQERRIDRSRRVIERDNEIKGGLALEPGVARAILPRQRPPLALPPMRPLTRRLRHDAPPLQMQREPSVAMSQSRDPQSDARGSA
jgi:hypothetical protein